MYIQSPNEQTKGHSGKEKLSAVTWIKLQSEPILFLMTLDMDIPYQDTSTFLQEVFLLPTKSLMINFRTKHSSPWRAQLSAHTSVDLWEQNIMRSQLACTQCTTLHTQFLTWHSGLARYPISTSALERTLRSLIHLTWSAHWSAFRRAVLKRSEQYKATM